MAPTRPLASRSFCLLALLCDHRSLSKLQQSNTRAWYTLHQNDRLIPFLVFMPPPLGAGGIMFSGCPSVRPSVRPKPEIPSFDLNMGPLVHPTNRNRFTACPSVRPSGEVSGHLPENAWREWPEILHADVSWPSPELISLWPWSVDFTNFGTILT